METAAERFARLVDEIAPREDDETYTNEMALDDAVKMLNAMATWLLDKAENATTKEDKLLVIDLLEQTGEISSTIYQEARGV